MSGLERVSSTVRDGSLPPTVFLARMNPLREEIDLSGVPDGAWVVCWSGSLADNMFVRDWGTWGDAGMSALKSFCARVAPEFGARGLRLVLRPHARHVLSDAFRCRRIVDENAHGFVGVALDAASMMEHSMLDDVEGHYERAFELLGPVADLVIVTGLARGDEEDGPPGRPPAPVEGAFAEMVGALIGAHVPGRTPVVRVTS